ncbi:hypothetical protein B0T16DRAFT_385451 [Cercophora newfieldiana]|uniref:Uncharacterized protein n=1 Tax=Cercophora newfieldiana TaxID=92897 RepID=A0AA39YQI9_9PEZI|nr:hypothetical protein B0T16DRAFT_385451 [Cercophora newfieldiana]
MSSSLALTRVSVLGCVYFWLRVTSLTKGEGTQGRPATNRQAEGFAGDQSGWSIPSACRAEGRAQRVKAGASQTKLKYFQVGLARQFQFAANQQLPAAVHGLKPRCRVPIDQDNLEYTLVAMPATSKAQASCAHRLFLGQTQGGEELQVRGAGFFLEIAGVTIWRSGLRAASTSNSLSSSELGESRRSAPSHSAPEPLKLFSFDEMRVIGVLDDFWQEIKDRTGRQVIETMISLPPVPPSCFAVNCKNSADPKAQRVAMSRPAWSYERESANEGFATKWVSDHLLHSFCGVVFWKLVESRESQMNVIPARPDMAPCGEDAERDMAQMN